MRILHVTAGIGRSNGVMSVILNYAAHMPEDIKFDVLYFTTTDGDRLTEIEDLGGRATKIAPPGVHSFFHDEVDDYLDAHRGEYAAIHIHLPYLASVFAPKAKRAGIPKVIVHCHSTVFSLGDSNFRNRILNLPTKSLANVMIACGRDAGRLWYGKRAVDSGRVTVLPNAVECDRFRFDAKVRDKLRREMGLGNDLTVGYVATMTPWKNHGFLLEVFQQLLEIRPKAKLMLVGDGPERKALEEKAAELHIADKTLFLGMRSNVAELLQAMDVFVMTSPKEGLPVCAIEAQAAGLPVLMSDGVTDEACITERINRLSLDEPKQVWAKEAVRLAELPRLDTADEVKRAGFDLAKNAKILVGLYGYGDKEKASIAGKNA